MVTGGGGQDLAAGGMDVLAMLMHHPDPTLGYRVTGKDGKVFVYATDNEHDEEAGRETDRLYENADLLVYDTQFTHQEYDPEACEKKWLSKKNWGHSITQEGIKVSERTGVKRLVPFHYAPESPDGKLDDIFAFAGKFRDEHCPSLELLPSYEGLAVEL